MKRNAGFTLIEVLIALMIIAIALAAVIQSVNQSIRVTDKVKSDMVAHWVAMNTLSEIQLGMIRVPESGDPVHGKSTMLGQQWEWEARENTENTAQYTTQVTVIVTLRGKRVDALSGFVGRV